MVECNKPFHIFFGKSGFKIDRRLTACYGRGSACSFLTKAVRQEAVTWSLFQAGCYIYLCTSLRRKEGGKEGEKEGKKVQGF